MRFQGRLSDWNDDKGFGFVIPNGGGERAFVHIKAFERRPQRPADGLLISYAIHKDECGRLNAAAVRPAVRRKTVAPRSSTSSIRLPRMALGAGALLSAVVLWQEKLIPDALMLFFVGLSIAALLVYRHDKNAAQQGRQRTPEKNLHLIALFGGWPGALIAQGWFRHKSSKRSFQVAFWLTVVFNLIATAWLVGELGISN